MSEKTLQVVLHRQPMIHAHVSAAYNLDRHGRGGVGGLYQMMSSSNL